MVDKNTRDVNDSGYTLDNVKKVHLHKLIQSIKTEYTNIVVSEPEIFDDYTVYNLSFQNDKLTISYNTNTEKLVVHGGVSNLSQLFLTIINISGLLGSDFIKRLLEIYGEKNKPDIYDLYKIYLPTIYNRFIDPAVGRLIKQSIINLENKNITDDVEFSMYVIPACRALEGTIKFNLHKCRIPFKGRFDMFDKVNDVYYLKSSISKGLDKRQIDAIENCYNLWSDRRNPISHFGNLVIDPVSGEVRGSIFAINSIQEAKDGIKEILDVIDKNSL